FTREAFMARLREKDIFTVLKTPSQNIFLNDLYSRSIGTRPHVLKTSEALDTSGIYFPLSRSRISDHMFYRALETAREFLASAG
ncbi:MAG: hypothetical protein ABIG11_05605, partial [bacterium]